MFNKNDLYTSLGSNKLYGCWTSLVTKFDTSSFYNWEQDNLPIYDLDERTHFLWERLGNATSAINGVALAVSADTTSSCNSNVFKTLSGCLQAVPEVINFPIVIEVASFGNLGTLSLSNKVFGPRGSIEIINRNFSKADPASVSGDHIVLNKDLYDTNSKYYLASAVSTPENSYSDGPGIFNEFELASSVILSSYVFSADNDVRLENNLTLFTKKANNGLDVQRLTAALAARNSANPFNEYSDNKYIFNAYEGNEENWDDIGLYDASCVNEITGLEIIWGSNNDTVGVNTIAYGNRLQGIKIYNCDGPIYIRGFTVDGSGYGGREYGIDVRNSSVYLENCSVARCTKAGLFASNSKVNILRSFIAYRNYSFTNAGVRNTSPWNYKIKSNYYSTSGMQDKAAGILAVNSDINFSSTYERDYSINRSSFISHYTPFNVENVNDVQPSYSKMLCLSKNDIGIYAINSTINGGKNETGGIGNGASYFKADNLVCELNTEAGIKLENSNFRYSGRLFLYGNFRGIDSYLSKISLDTIVAKFNQKEGCRLENSKLNYNKDLYLPNLILANATCNIHQNSYFLNGVHLRLVNSTYEPTDTSSIPTYYERFYACSSFGVLHDDPTNNKGYLPPVIVDSNSRLRLISPVISNSQDFTDLNGPMFGAAISVENNSEAILQGTSGYVTKLVGPEDYEYQYNKAALYAGNNSTIKLQGPTVIAQYGVDALAEDNSKIEITPHRDEDGKLLVTQFDLSSPAHHTIVELHSTRACLVANRNSTISIEDLGNYDYWWGLGTYGQAALLSGVDYITDSEELGYDIYISGGSLQFYPNPNDEDEYGAGLGVDNIVSMNAYTQDAVRPNAYGYYILDPGQYVGEPNNAHEFRTTTAGGMCVRAVNNSVVNVDNVHFPCGHWNPSSVVYQTSSTEGDCSKLFIWNIADKSYLNAKLISVSGHHPADVPYFGPSGTWGSVSALPENTPDTSSVSILDLFGKGTGHRYANTSATNQGPFRLYFSVDPAINWALSSSTSGGGLLPQLYSQGYHFMSSIHFPGNVSSYYKATLQSNGLTSGVYYATSIITDPYSVKALLDDSASNAFANSKHNSVGKSGFAKVVSIYFPYTGIYGGDSSDGEFRDRAQGVRSLNTFDLEKNN